MNMKKVLFIIAGCSVIVSVAVSLLTRQRAETEFRENAMTWAGQSNQLAQLSAENERLANEAAHVKSNASSQSDPAELAALRAKAGALRQQTSRLAQQVAQERRQAGTKFYSTGDYNLLDHNKETRMTFRGGPRETGKLNDARALADALLKSAEKHQGVFPKSLDEITEYLPKPLKPDSGSWKNAPLSGTNRFEVIYQGSQDELTNIPPRRVALLREQQPWQTPDGKWARVYAYADGAASMVESDDNFQSWEAQHVVPTQQAGN